MSQDILDASLDPTPQQPAGRKWVYLILFGLGIAIIASVILILMIEERRANYENFQVGGAYERPNTVPYLIAYFSVYLVGISWYALLLHQKSPTTNSFLLAMYAPLLAGLALILNVQIVWAWDNGINSIIRSNPFYRPNMEDIIAIVAASAGAFWVGLITILTARKQWRWLVPSVVGGIAYLILVIYVSGG